MIRRDQHMPPIDMRLPASHLRVLAGLDSFTMILPKHVKLAQIISVEGLVRAHGVPDEVFEAFLNNEKIPEDAMDPIVVKFLDVHYIRECRLRNVIDGEWKRAYGPKDPKTLVTRYADPEINMDTVFRVICFTSPDYDLRKLRKQYTSKSRNSG